MNQRLVWNFEINNEQPLDCSHLHDQKEDLRWEVRYFWPEHTIISLQGLDENFLDLSSYDVKHREDYYLLLADSTLNIKLRRTELLYKPLLSKTLNLYGYGKKINLTNYPANHLLPATDNFTATELVIKLENQAQKIQVSKEALIYKFSTQPTIKLELARIRIKEKNYFSVCIEGRSQLLVARIANHLLQEQISCDYVNFLKQFYNGK